MIRVLFICHGNICRSPMAEFMLKDKVEKMNLKDKFEISSMATSDEEIWEGRGNPVYPPAKDELLSHGIGKSEYTDFKNKRARRITPSDYDSYDYILCMDENNLWNLSRMGFTDKNHKIHLLLDYTKRKGRDIADPWYTGNFIRTYSDIEEGLNGFLEYLLKKGEI